MRSWGESVGLCGIIPIYQAIEDSILDDSTSDGVVNVV